MKKLINILFIWFPFSSAAQDSSLNEKKGRLSISGYADIYYQYDFNKPADKLRPPFLYNFKKHNELRSNLTLVKAAYEGKRFRSNLGLMIGDYATYNLAAEPELFRYVYEASVGFKFSEKISADAGIFPSHIGAESAITKDNWNLSRSISAESSPYYETGIKFNYNPNEKWRTSFLVLQGWQNIKDNNSSKAIGAQVQFIPNEKLLFNSSAFIGNERSDSTKQLRLFHDFFITFNITEEFKTLFMLDLGAEQKIDKTGYNKWMGTALLFQYSFTKKFTTAVRVEFYRDKNGVIVSNYLPTQFETTGFALNFDYQPTKNFVLRTEMRSLHSKNKIFTRNNMPVQSNFSLLASAAFFF